MFLVLIWSVFLTHVLILVVSPCLSIVVLFPCLSKKGDHSDPKNWHPISLLNVHYKLAECVIADRLLKLIHLVVDKDQTCGIPGRFIGENVEDRTVSLLSVDFLSHFSGVFCPSLARLDCLICLVRVNNGGEYGCVCFLSFVAPDVTPWCSVGPRPSLPTNAKYALLWRTQWILMLYKL